MKGSKLCCLEGETRGNEKEAIFEKIIDKNLPELFKYTKVQIQKSNKSRQIKRRKGERERRKEESRSTNHRFAVRLEDTKEKQKFWRKPEQGNEINHLQRNKK